MKKFTAIIIGLMISAMAFGQGQIVGPTPWSSVSGTPVAKTAKKSLTGALVTLTGSFDKDVKYQRACTEEGFVIKVPYGEYDLAITVDGYEPYKIELSVDGEEIDLGIIRMLTTEEAEAKRLKAKKKQ